MQIIGQCHLSYYRAPDLKIASLAPFIYVLYYYTCYMGQCPDLFRYLLGFTYIDYHRRGSLGLLGSNPLGQLLLLISLGKI